MNALRMIGIPIAGVAGGPLSAWILNAFQGANGLAGWQWLFVIEAAVADPRRAAGIAAAAQPGQSLIV